MFIMRLSASGRSFVAAFAHQAQEAFFEGHVLAFAAFGGVPTGQIRYDNLKPAVNRILQGRDRTENERFTALRSHYLLGSMRSSASPASKAPMRRAGWRARSAGSAAGIWSRSPTSRVWPRSTN
jgi:transposase